MTRLVLGALEDLFFKGLVNGGCLYVIYNTLVPFISKSQHPFMMTPLIAASLGVVFKWDSKALLFMALILGVVVK